jgi:hypothetical protein
MEAGLRRRNGKTHILPSERGLRVVHLPRLVRVGLSASLVTFLLLVSFPSAPAAPAPEQATLDLYLAANALSPSPPTGATAAARSIVATASLPTAGAAVLTAQISEWGRYKFPVDTRFTSNGAVTVWVTADTAAVINDVRGYVYKGAGTTSLASGGRGLYADQTAGTSNQHLLTPGRSLKFELGLNLQGLEWKAGEEFTLKFWVSAATAAGTPVDVRIQYGSLDRPSRISAAVSDLGGVVAPNALRSYFFTADGLTREAPSATTSLRRVSESMGAHASAPQGSSVATATTWSWGKLTLEEPVTAQGEALVSVWTTVDGAQKAGVLRGLRVLLEMKPPTTPLITRQQDVGIAARSYESVSTANAATSRFVMAVNMTGIDLPAGSTLEVKFIVWSTNNDPPGRIVFLYGSTAHPASVQFTVPGGAAPPPLDEEEEETPETTPTPTNTTTAPTSTTPTATTAAATNETAVPAQADPRERDAAVQIPGAGLLAAAAALAAVLVAIRRRR